MLGEWRNLIGGASRFKGEMLSSGVRVLSDNSVVRSRKQVNQGKLRGRGKNLESLSTNVENPYG